jgi:hypothetical protein
MDQNETGREAIEISEPAATVAKTQTDPRRNASLDRAADKRADVARAKKKKKRDAHKVALRRSHTKG